MSEFKKMRTVGFFKPHDGGPVQSLGEIKIESFVETSTFFDPDTGAVVRTETRTNGVLRVEDGK